MDEGEREEGREGGCSLLLLPLLLLLFVYTQIFRITNSITNTSTPTVTYCLPYRTYRAFLCVDEPAVKATFTVTLIVLAHHTAISNMPESSSAHIAGGKKKVCMLYCIVLYCVILCFIVSYLYCITLYCMVLYSIV